MAEATRPRAIPVALYFAADIASRTSRWLTYLALGWLGYGLTGSPATLGILVFCYNFPVFLLSVAGGVVADRFPRWDVAAGVYAGQLAIAAALAGLASSGQLAIWAVYLSAILAGTLAAIGLPSVLALLRDIAGTEALFARLGSAEAANSKLAQAAAAVLFALTFAAAQPAGVFLAAAALALAAVVAVLGLRAGLPGRPPDRRPGARETLVDGLRYVRDHRTLALLILLAATGIAVWGFAFFQVPALVARHLGGGHWTMSLVYGAGAFGGLAGGLLVARRRPGRGLLLWLIAGNLAIACAMVVLLLTSNAWVAALAVALLDLGFVFAFGIADTALQALADDARRGRVLGIFAMAVYGAIAVYGALAGILAHAVGLGPAMLVSVVLVVVVTMLCYAGLGARRRSIDAL